MTYDRKKIILYTAQPFRLADFGALNRISVARKCSGFTLIELLMVIAIIGVLSTMAIPAFNNYKDKSKNTRATADIKTIGTEISGYVIDKLVPPDDLSDPAINRATFKDPWGNLYVYSKVSALIGPFTEKLNTDYDLYSKGKDGQSVPAFGDPLNTDDIARSNDGNFVGMRPTGP